MAKGKTYELALKIAGRVDSSLKKACLDADENLGKLAKTAEKIGKAAKVAAGVTAAAATAVGVAAVKSYTEHEQAVNSMAAATGAARRGTGTPPGCHGGCLSKQFWGQPPRTRRTLWPWWTGT